MRNSYKSLINSTELFLDEIFRKITYKNVSLKEGDFIKQRY